ncbi:class I SAM-dependent methyltransferase [Candidatus Electronema sp. JM]|uniref:class I SAM-dependent methyltransferase n=1 Tax=Candidatus Electronema sp. JM TaxID=3401571 RepID=UPI003AA96DE3
MRKMSGEAAASGHRFEIAVDCAAPELLAQAEELAARLGLPLAENGARHQLLLRCTAEGLELLKPDDPQLRGPLRVDFTAGAMDFRRKQPGKELLLRAVGCKTGRPLAVLDATGGLGRDSFLLAAAGCTVHVFEREPVQAALLADGLERARQCPDTAAIAARIRLTAGDVLPFLHEMRTQGQVVDAIYFDPMFPERRKSALVKKEAQLLQLLAQPASPAAEKELLAAARAVSHRVAVKRPAKATFLGEAAPSHSLVGATVRFDVYLSSSGQPSTSQ